MPQSIIERIADVVNPTQVSNVIYEIMVDWRSYTMRINNNEPRKTRMRDKRETLEVVLARFLNTDVMDTRRMLEAHFGIKVKGKR